MSSSFKLKLLFCMTLAFNMVCGQSWAWVFHKSAHGTAKVTISLLAGGNDKATCMTSGFIGIKTIYFRCLTIGATKI